MQKPVDFYDAQERFHTTTSVLSPALEITCWSRKPDGIGAQAHSPANSRTENTLESQIRPFLEQVRRRAKFGRGAEQRGNWLWRKAKRVENRVLAPLYKLLSSKGDVRQCKKLLKIRVFAPYAYFDYTSFRRLFATDNVQIVRTSHLEEWGL